MDKAIFGLTLAAAVGSGLMAGLFYGFSIAVMRALRRISPPSGIAAMQAINVVIINPWFMAVFMGTVLISAGLVVVSFFDLGEPESILTIAGGALYLVGAFLVTMAFNVPRNNALDAVDADSIQGAELWEKFVPEWTAWNTVRTIAALAASVAFTIALVVG